MNLPMNKNELMENLKAFIIYGTKTWEQSRDYIIDRLDAFSEILEQHLLSPEEFLCVLPFVKEIFLFAPPHFDDMEPINRTYYAIKDCKNYYAEAMKGTPMDDFLEMVFNLLGHKFSSPEEGRNLNRNIETLVFAILMKCKGVLRGEEGL